MTLVIAATRMHRSLIDFAHRSPDVYDVFYDSILSRFLPHDGRYRFSARENIQDDRIPVPETKRISPAWIPNDRMVVAMDVFSEQHWAPQIRDDASMMARALARTSRCVIDRMD